VQLGRQRGLTAQLRSLGRHRLRRIKITCVQECLRADQVRGAGIGRQVDGQIHRKPQCVPRVGSRPDKLLLVESTCGHCFEFQKFGQQGRVRMTTPAIERSSPTSPAHRSPPISLQQIGFRCDHQCIRQLAQGSIPVEVLHCQFTELSGLTDQTCGQQNPCPVHRRHADGRFFDRLLGGLHRSERTWEVAREKLDVPQVV
jgi:hypothetical protein